MKIDTMQSSNLKEVEIIYKNDLPINVKFQGKFIHSINPGVEAKRQFEHFIKNINEKKENIIFFKIGLGFIIDEFIEKTSLKLIWFEPIEKIRNAAIERLSKTILNFYDIQNKRIFIHSEFNLEYIKKLNESILNYEIFFLKSYLDKNDYVLIDLFYKKKFYFQVNLNTLNKFEDLWISNFFKNLLFINKVYPINVLKNIIANQTLLIVAGGPSLDEWIPIIKKYKEHFWILSVDTALNTLVKNQIIPDFILSVDAQSINYLYLEKYTGLESTFIIDPTTYYQLIKRINYQKKVVIFSNLLPFVSYLLDKAFSEKVIELKSGGSVATIALDLASLMGANPIFFCGLDLSFPKNLIHTKFSLVDMRHLFKTNRTHSFEFFNFKQTRALTKKFCFNHQNQIVLTNDKLLIFKNWFEKNYHSYKDKNIYVLYGNGCIIQNFQYIFNENGFHQLINKSFIKSSIEEIKQKKKDNLKKTYYKIIKNLIEMDKIISNINKILSIKEKLTFEKLQEIHILEEKLKSYEELQMIIINEPLNNLTTNTFKENIQISKEIYEKIQIGLRKLVKKVYKSLHISHIIDDKE
ncbi:MAG: DUF115 domain-containing protein [Leptospiraceae bacterium]|nr:DUF115 domain-containing protein [Leptospiraceae bacterium]MDW7976203.1 DUF115 domain-containing protein [Leptospiraceae bacterium]